MLKVLVVSDNVLMVDYFNSLLAEDMISEIATIECRYSIVNKDVGQFVERGMLPVDVKRDVDLLVSKYDLIVSAHCKQIFPSRLVNNVRCINIHPGYNPCNRGWYPQVFSIINKKKVGATIHLMDEEVDNGEIIIQQEVSIYPEDTSKEVYERVVETEKKLIKENFADILLGRYSLKKTESCGNYNGVGDFKKLCLLDLNMVGRLGDHIDLLRAISHGDFKNGYFMDGEDKVFVKISLEREA